MKKNKRVLTRLQGERMKKNKRPLVGMLALHGWEARVFYRYGSAGRTVALFNPAITVQTGLASRCVRAMWFMPSGAFLNQWEWEGKYQASRPISMSTFTRVQLERMLKEVEKSAW